MQESAARWDEICEDKDGHVVIKAMFLKSAALSNLHPHQLEPVGAPPLQIPYPTSDGEVVVFNSSETAYQYAKAEYFEKRLRLKLNFTASFMVQNFPPTGIGPFEAKKRGGKCNFLNYIRKGSAHPITISEAKKLYDTIERGIPDDPNPEDNWFASSKSVMEKILRIKFSALNPMFVELLKRTGTRKIYEQKFRSGSVWERQGCITDNKESWGWMGELLVQIRADNNENMSTKCQMEREWKEKVATATMSHEDINYLERQRAFPR
mgnify:CR=1 FL=1|tara:strand:- start:454 stop:1248 length:795 start_codon:yes stop_codon:yes gene_type:complete